MILTQGERRHDQYDLSQSMLLPVYFEEQLIPGTLEFVVHTLVETRVDMIIFDGSYQNDETGRRAYDPEVLLKVVLFAYLSGLISSRKIERACRENVTFMALSGNQRPDHSTIAAFVSQLLEELITSDQDGNTDLPNASSCENQIEKLQKQADRIENWLAENDAKIGANGRELQSNVTDNESAEMKTSHGTIQG